MDQFSQNSRLPFVKEIYSQDIGSSVDVLRAKRIGQRLRNLQIKPD